MAQDRARLRRTLARNLARQARRGVPTPEQVTASRVESLQTRISQRQAEIVPRELTMAQRRVAGKIPEPKAVVSVGERAGGFSIAGRAKFPEPGGGAKTLNRLFDWATRQNRRQTQISLAAATWESSTAGKGVEAALRHEVGHHLLAARGIRSAEHEPILAQATVPGTTTGVNFRLLQTAAEAHRAPTEEQQRRLSQQRLKLGVAARRRSNR